MAQITIEHCDFKVVCSKSWDDLKPIDGKDGLRYCSGCKKDIQLIKTSHDIEMARIFDVCVAVQKTDELTGDNQKDTEDESENLFVTVSLLGSFPRK